MRHGSICALRTLFSPWTGTTLNHGSHGLPNGLMPAFIEQFAACISREKARLAIAFGPSTDGPHEESLRDAIGKSWRPLAVAPGSSSRRVFATDGSQAIRHFSNGWSVIVCQALCVGPEFESSSVDVRFVRSTVPEGVLTRYAGLLMRRLEIRAALDNVERAMGGVMCLDGSLHAALPHLLYPLASEEDRDLPLVLLENYLDLVDACASREVLLVSLSKTSTGSFLAEALLRLNESNRLSGDAQLDETPLASLPSDMEVIYRWTTGPGYSRPLVLGTQGFGDRRSPLISAPERIVGAFADRRFSFPERLALLDRLVSASATVSSYVRLRQDEDPIRLDVMASSVGVADRIRDTYTRWADEASLDEVLSHLVDAYGGRSVYHAALYVADRLVRLQNATVDSAYLSIIRAQFGAFVQYDRSRRRFL